LASTARSLPRPGLVEASGARQAVTDQVQAFAEAPVVDPAVQSSTKDKGSTASPRRRRRRATYNRTQGVRHLMAALDLGTDKMYGHGKVNKNRTTFLGFCR